MKKLFWVFALLIVGVASQAMADGFVAAPHDGGWFFQDGQNELESRVISFHNYVFKIIAVITALVLGLIGYICIKFNRKANPVPSKTTHNTLLEVVWTVVPILIVVAIMIPSLRLLYYVDKTDHADLTLKVTGYQWYWGYEYPDLKVAEFESRLIPTDQLKPGQKKLLEVDEPLYVPVGKTVKVLLTGDAAGVIHAWGIPSLAFKRDTMPGRINEGWIKIEKEGTYYGECYELCGVDHAFMPIKIMAVSEDKFNAWVVSKGGKIPTLEAPKSEAVVPEVKPAEAAKAVPAKKENKKK